MTVVAAEEASVPATMLLATFSRRGVPMNKLHRTIAGAAALLIAAACTDKPITENGRTLQPRGSSRDGNAVTGAVYTSTNPIDDTDLLTNNHNLCQNQKDSNAPAINCNIYFAKDFVWLSGGPGPSNLAPGDYMFAVLVPGGQGSNNDPNDCTDKNLSDTSPCDNSDTGSGDIWQNRVFTVQDDGTLSYSGTHKFVGGMIRLMGYDDTTSPGGEYIMAVCSLAGRDEHATNGPGVDPSLCKYDAFKVDATKPCPNPDANDCEFHFPATLSIVKTINTKWDRTFKWGVTKAVDKTKVSQVGGTVTFNYTVGVTHDAGTDAIGYSGTVVVSNGPSGIAHNVVITDPLAPSLACFSAPNVPFVSGSDLAPNAVISCVYSETTNSTAAVTNVARVDYASEDAEGNPTTPFATDQKTGTFVEHDIDDCIHVTDPNSPNPPLPADVCSSAASPTTFNYARVITVKADECDPYENTATIVTNTNGITKTASQTVTVCGGVAGGLTMGFWQNKNGQAIITGGASTSSVCNSATWLRTYAPFLDLAANSTCTQVGSYVTNIIKSANASGAAMNAMLKGQMLATALDVYFSTPALGGNKINAPLALGGVKVDLTKICKMIDGSGGTATCGGTFSDASGAFNGATALTVSQILAYAASQSNAGGSTWYGQVKATQELAKNTFDAINNAVALTAP